MRPVCAKQLFVNGERQVSLGEAVVDIVRASLHRFPEAKASTLQFYSEFMNIRPPVKGVSGENVLTLLCIRPDDGLLETRSLFNLILWQ